MPFDDLKDFETARNEPPELVEDTGLKRSGAEDALRRVAEATMDLPAQDDVQVEQPQEQITEQQADTPKSAEPEAKPTIDPRIQAVIDKYGGRLEEVAKATLSAQQKMTESSQQRSELERELTSLRSEINMLRSTIAPNYQQQGQAQPQPQDFIKQINESFFDNPAESLWKLMEARDQQRKAEDAQRDFQQFATDNADKLEKLNPEMQRLYQANRMYYDSMPPNEAAKQLLRSAEKEQTYNNAISFIGQLQALGYPINANQAKVATQPQQTQAQQQVGSGMPTSTVGQAGDLRQRELYKKVRETGGYDDWVLADYLKTLGVADHLK